MSHLPVYTAVAAGLLMLLQLILMLLVGLNRGKYAQSIGDGGNDDLLLAIRRHGNLAENAAIFLVLLALLEILTGSTIIVLTLAIAFVVARIAHAIGLSLGPNANPPRVVGAFGTLLSGLILAVYLIYASLPLMN
ncbi:MAG: MAPEG family protein [Pseudomonadota bacterium]